MTPPHYVAWETKSSGSLAASAFLSSPPPLFPHHDRHSWMAVLAVEYLHSTPRRAQSPPQGFQTLCLDCLDILAEMRRSFPPALYREIRPMYFPRQSRWTALYSNPLKCTSLAITEPSYWNRSGERGREEKFLSDHCQTDGRTEPLQARRTFAPLFRCN